MDVTTDLSQWLVRTKDLHGTTSMLYAKLQTLSVNPPEIDLCANHLGSGTTNFMT